MSEAPPPPPPPIDDDAPPPPPPSEEDIEKHPLVLQLRREVAQLRAQLSDTASAVSVVLRDLRMIRDDANALCTNSVDHAEIFSTGSSGSAQSFGSNLVSDSFPNQTSLSLTNLQPKTLKRQPGAPLGFKISDRVIVTALAVGGPAALAGLGLGDCIVGVGGKDVEGSTDTQVIKLLSSIKPGSNVNIEIIPAGEIDKAVASLPQRKTLKLALGSDGKFGLGISLHIVVTKVLADSPASAEGVAVGDRILDVYGKDCRGRDTQYASQILAEFKDMPVQIVFGQCSLAASDSAAEKYTTCI